MQGYQVVTSDDEKVGHVVGTIGDYLIVEQGAIRKSKRALPRQFAHVHDDEQCVRITVTRDILEDAPKIEGDDGFDEQAVAAHYGLAAGEPQPETLGDGELLPTDPAWSAEQEELRIGVEPAAQQRVRIRGGLSKPGEHEPGPAGRPIIPPDPHR